MSVRRLVSVLSVCLMSAGVASAQPKGGAPAPAKEPAPTGMEPAADAPPADPGADVQMAEDPPPSDMEGTNENPDAPRELGGDTGPKAVPAVVKKTGFPIEEIYRPITLPQNMSEVSLNLHAAASDFTGSGDLRARYGITRQVQLGLTYLWGGLYAEKNFVPGETGGTKFHPGKAVGVDLTVLLTDWIGVRVGVPVYIDPVAVGLNLGVPLRFVLFDKLAIGGLEDLLSFRITKFVPTFYQESTNATAASGTDSSGGNNTVQSRGAIRFSGYGIYQHSTQLSIHGRLGVTMDDFNATRSNAGDASGLTTFLRVGLQYAVNKSFDVGGSLGFDDMARVGSFGPAAYVNIRI